MQELYSLNLFCCYFCLPFKKNPDNCCTKFYYVYYFESMVFHYILAFSFGFWVNRVYGILFKTSSLKSTP